MKLSRCFIEESTIFLAVVSFIIIFIHLPDNTKTTFKQSQYRIPVLQMAICCLKSRWKFAP